MLWWSLSLAYAHVPHDTVRAFGATPGPWWLLADPSSTRLLLRSDDRGATYTMVGGEPIADLPNQLTTLDDGTVVLLGEQAYWWSADEGNTWSHADRPVGATLLTGGPTVVLAGPGGLWEGAPGALVASLSDLAISVLGRERVAVTSGGDVQIDVGGGWTHLEGPGVADASAVTTDGTVVYVGTHTGAVWRYTTGTWSPCAALPAYDGTETSYPDIVNLTMDGATVLAATGWRAPFVSGDGCATWIDRHTTREVSYDTSGGAEGPDSAWPFLAVVDGRWVLGGWQGYWWSDDQGLTWADTPMIPPDYTRGLAFTSDFTATPRIFIGTYGAGPAFTDDGGASFSAPAHGVRDPNVQRLETAGVGDDPNLVYGIIGHDGYSSRDGGESWTPFSFATESVNDITTFRNSGEIWAFAKGDPQLVMASVDAGGTWTPLTSLQTALGASLAGSAAGFLLANGRGARCVTTREPSGMVCAMENEDGTSGEAWHSAPLPEGGDRNSAPLGWPPGAATRVLWSEDDGIHLSDDLLGTAVLAGGATATVHSVYPTGDDGPISFVGASEGTLFLATEAGALWRSSDGGETWEDLAIRFPAWVHVMAARPDFATHPDLLVGTHDGLFLVADATGATPTLARWAYYQRIDDESDYFECAECPARRDDPTAGMDTVRPVPANVTATARLRGTEIRVLGRLADGGAAELWVDGAWVSDLSPAREGVTGGVTGLTDGWHDVEIRGLAGQGVYVDALEAYGPGARLDVPEADEPPPQDSGRAKDPGGCGCEMSSVYPTSHGSGLGVILGGALLLGTRRLRTGRGIRPPSYGAAIRVLTPPR